MPVIQELSPHLADLIAAGEVVERPASVAKELIENSIDAGSTRITVEIENGGISYLRIMDNGCGISPEDAPTAFLRHATSKIKNESDLSAIGTLGFRGEALAAISSVTRIDMFTRQKSAIAGLHLRLEAGKIKVKEEAGCPEGTTLVVRDLFFNTPARIKFLKKDFTEAGYVLGVVQHAALSHPEIAMTLVRDGKQVFTTDGKGKLIVPVFAVFGRELTESMIEVPRTLRAGSTVFGYITKPHAGRANRSMQYFFVNGRYVKSKLMQAALEEAYKNAIITGKYPSGAVFLNIPLELVDVNVHPSKTEVKFSQEKSVFDAVYFACKNALMAGDNIPELRPSDKRKNSINKETVPKHAADNAQEVFPGALNDTVAKEVSEKDFEISVPPRAKINRVPSAPNNFKVSSPLFFNPGVQASKAVHSSGKFKGNPEDDGVVKTPEPEKTSANAKKTEVVSKTVPEVKPHQNNEFKIGAARVIGECFQTYIIAEDENGLILIDKHAAHERILFNRLRDETDIPQQELLSPVIVELTGEETAAIQSSIGDIRKAGFDIDLFGDHSFAVRSAPAYLDAGEVSSVISELAEKAVNSRTTVPDRLDELIHMVACKAAIKAGSPTSKLELQDLCDRVAEDENVRSCPHGRPTTVRLTKYELDKLFKRVNQ